MNFVILRTYLRSSIQMNISPTFTKLREMSYLAVFLLTDLIEFLCYITKTRYIRCKNYMGKKVTSSLHHTSRASGFILLRPGVSGGSLPDHPLEPAGDPPRPLSGARLRRVPRGVRPARFAPSQPSDRLE